MHGYRPQGLSVAGQATPYAGGGTDIRGYGVKARERRERAFLRMGVPGIVLRGGFAQKLRKVGNNFPNERGESQRVLSVGQVVPQERGYTLPLYT